MQNKVYDCFTFFNELDLLEIRLNILNDVVDTFVLVEGTKTFTNKDKPLYYKENQERFKKFKDKIIHIIVDDYPPFTTAWEFEYHQRNAIARGLTQCSDSDTILISDVDEIPNPAKIKAYTTTPGVKVFKQYMFYYFLNMINITNPYWANISTKMLPYALFKKHNSSAQEIRFLKGTLITDGGWHFSYLGGVTAIAQKIQAFAHQELNSAETTNLENIRKRIQNGEDIFYTIANHNKYARIALDDRFPKYIRDNQDQYRNLIAPVTITLIEKLTLHWNSFIWTCILYLKQIKNSILRKI